MLGLEIMAHYVAFIYEIRSHATQFRFCMRHNYVFPSQGWIRTLWFFFIAGKHSFIGLRKLWSKKVRLDWTCLCRYILVSHDSDISVPNGTLSRSLLEVRTLYGRAIAGFQRFSTMKIIIYLLSLRKKTVGKNSAKDYERGQAFTGAVGPGGGRPNEWVLTHEWSLGSFFHCFFSGPKDRQFLVILRRKVMKIKIWVKY